MTRSELGNSWRDQLARRGRLLLALAAAGAAVLVAVTWRSDDLDRDLLLAQARIAGLPIVRHEPLAFQMSREADRGERRLAAARVLLLNRTKVESKSLDTVAERVRRLVAIESLAAEALVSLPASWEAPMILGLARFEQRLVAHDTRLFSEASRWERPLSAAVARSHAASAAEQNLAAAYLEVYPALSPERRPQVAETLRHALADWLFRQRHIQRWLAVAGTLENAELLLPSDSDTLGALAGAAWSRSETRAALDDLARQRRTLRLELSEALEAALGSSRKRTSDPAASLSSVVLRSPIDDEFAPLVRTALGEIEPQTHIDPRLTDAAIRWLTWSQPLCLIWECPFPAATFDRLSQLAAPKLATETAAFAALAAGDTERAERLAKETGALLSEAWAPYLILAGKKRLERNEPGLAALLLSKVSPNEQERPILIALRSRTGVPQRADASAQLVQESWGPASWRRASPWTMLELGAGRRATGLRVAFATPLQLDALLALEWDGRRLEPAVVSAGESSMRISVEIEPGIHLFRFSTLFGKLPPFGETRLD